MAIRPPPSPPPINSPWGSPEWMRWLRDITRKVTTEGGFDWELLNQSNSDVADLARKSHGSLTDILAADDTSADTTANRHITDAHAKAQTDHIAATSAHGATGDIVGNEDYATAAIAGVVLLAAAVTNATASVVSPTASTVSVDSADASDLATAITLVNEIKADVNTLVSDVNTLVTDVGSVVSDLNDAITQLNALLASERTALQLDT